MERGGDDSFVLDRLLKSFQTRIDSIGSPASSSSSSSDTNLTKDDDYIEVYVESEGDPREPTLRPKYGEWPEDQIKENDEENLFVAVHNKPDWPTEEDCDTEWISRPPQWNEFPTVFLSPENKGYE